MCAILKLLLGQNSLGRRMATSLAQVESGEFSTMEISLSHESRETTRAHTLAQPAIFTALTNHAVASLFYVSSQILNNYITSLIYRSSSFTGEPRFLERLPERIITSVDYNQTLRCHAETEEMLDVAYIWTHNGMVIRDKDMLANPRIKIDGGILDLINITFAEAGEYECIVKSAVGSIKTKTMLYVEGPPGPPGGVQVVNVAKTSVTLQWMDGAYNGRMITVYRIYARTNWNQTLFIVSDSKFNF